MLHHVESNHADPNKHNHPTDGILINNSIKVRIKEKAPIKASSELPKESIVPLVALKSSKRGRKSIADINADNKLLSIPDDETLAKKLYYSITEVAKWFHVSPHLLRYWEVQFKDLKPKKNKKGDRFYSVENIKQLEVIYFLLREKKLSVGGAQQYLDRKKGKKMDDEMFVRDTLKNMRNFLLLLKESL
ncbi:MAG: MerR family transcriptional regulator [Phycisphaerales bacterium]|nr:MerR family transcriptional regulator [Phycisphaerales bacterium]